jgi:hypothetical protein
MIASSADRQYKDSYMGNTPRAAPLYNTERKIHGNTFGEPDISYAKVVISDRKELPEGKEKSPSNYSFDNALGLTKKRSQVESKVLNLIRIVQEKNEEAKAKSRKSSEKDINIENKKKMKICTSIATP